MKIPVIILCLITLFACGKKDVPVTGYSKKNTLMLKELNQITDSMNLAWKVMMKSDDAKLANIKRLLEEISYTKKYDEVAYDSLMKLQKAAIEMRLQPETMANADIDSYDQATDFLIKRTLNLMNYTPEIGDHPIAGQLQNEILAADNEVVLYRYKYDKWAKKYNAFIKEKETILDGLGAPYNEFKPRPLFQLDNNQ